MNVVYSGTRNLYPGMRGAIRSLLDHNEDVKVYVLAEDDTLPFEIPCDHKIINVSGQTYFPPDSPNIHNQFTYMAMLRVCTPDLIDEDRVIQLDVDTIVCDSLKPMWDVDLADKWVAWVKEYKSAYRPFGKDYYNFGVATLNLEQMRKDSAMLALVYELNRKPYQFIDQDVMNMFAIPFKTVDLPVRFNESFCCGYTANPAIVHYAGYPNWYESTTMPRWEYKEKYKNES